MCLSVLNANPTKLQCPGPNDDAAACCLPLQPPSPAHCGVPQYMTVTPYWLTIVWLCGAGLRQQANINGRTSMTTLLTKTLIIIHRTSWVLFGRSWILNTKL